MTISDKDLRMSQLLAKKHRYEEERSKLALQMQELDCKITEVQAEYGAIYNTQAPVLKLPTEVTCMIFRYASGYPKQGDSETGRHLLLEVVVSHVCHQWRSVSLAYPRLWASFCYDGPNSRRIPLDRLEAYMERSEPQNLDLWFEFSGCGDKFFEEHLSLVEKAVSHVARWNRFTIHTDSDTPMTSIIDLLDSSSAPNLEHFAFCPDVSPSGALFEVKSLESNVFGNGAPILTSVILDTSTALVCIPPLANVTTLRIEMYGSDIEFSFSWSAFLEVLALPCLTNLSLVGDLFEPPDVSILEPFQMNNLRHLRYSCHSFVLLLPFLRAPLLQTLTVQNDWLPEEFGGLQPEPYNFPSLRQLSILESTASSARAAWYFAQMTKSATELFFSQEDYSESIFSALQRGTYSEKKCWPKLKSLIFNLFIADEIEDVVHFVRTSFDPHNSLVVHVFDRIHDQWKEHHHVQYAYLGEICSLEVMDSDDKALWQAHWPPGEDYSDLIDDEDPFDIQNYYCY